MRYDNYGKIFFKPVICSFSNRATTVKLAIVFSSYREIEKYLTKCIFKDKSKTHSAF